MIPYPALVIGKTGYNISKWHTSITWGAALTCRRFTTRPMHVGTQQKVFFDRTIYEKD